MMDNIKLWIKTAVSFVMVVASLQNVWKKLTYKKF